MQPQPGPFGMPGMRPGMMMPNGMPYPGMPGPFMPGAGPPGMMPQPGMLRPPPQMMRPPPQQMVRPMAPTLPKPAGGRAVSGGAASASRSTTCYVGKIAPSLEDSVVRALLEACGPVTSWKRMQDSDGRPKGFGFCEFKEADGVIRALRHLNGLDVDGQELLVKCSAATQQYADEYLARKAVEAAARKAAAEEADAPMPDADGEEGALPGPPAGDPEVAKDNEVLEKIMTIVSDRATVSKPAASGGAAGASEAAASFLSGLGGADDHASARSSRDRDDRHRVRSREREREPEPDRELERQRAAERKEAELRAIEADRAYRDRLAKLEKRERDRLRELDRMRDKEAAAEKERMRQIKIDIAGNDDTDDELPAWQRRPYSTSRRADERRRKRMREQQEDEADRQAEAEEKRHRKEADAASSDAELDLRQNGHALPVLNAAPEPAVDPEDPIYRAMIAAARAPAVKAELNGAATASPSATQSSGGGGSAAAGFGRPPVRRPTPLLSAFGGDDDDDKPRALKKLSYTAEELAAGQAQASPAQQGATPERSVADTQELMKQIVARMPTDKGAVFSYPIAWATYDGIGPEGKNKISQWVTKTIKELLGEEEQTLVEHVMQKLGEHSSPEAMLEEMQPILDTDAEKFVLKMYRFVIYESEKAKELL